MQFEKETKIKKVGYYLGFLFGFLLFSSVVYAILKITKKVPNYIKYSYVVLAVILVYSIGLLCQRVYKKWVS